MVTEGLNININDIEDDDLREKVVKYFLISGSVPEQGYKACVSLTKLSKRYGKKKLEAACERMLTFSCLI